MKRLSTKIIATHLAVAVIAVGATAITVRLLAPVLFDASMDRTWGPVSRRRLPADWIRLLREPIGDDVTLALVLGGVLAVLVAGLFGLWFSNNLLRSLTDLASATKQLAAGRYDVKVPKAPEKELAALGSDINVLATNLAETEARRLRLLGEVAHELRTPLTVIDGTVEGMIDNLIDPSPENLAVISDETRRMRRLADDFSQLSKAAEGQLAIAKSWADLTAIVARVLQRLAPQIEDAGLGLATDLPNQPVWANVDADRIAQVVTNIVGNAIQATETGGISVSMTVAPNRCTIAIADTGSGLTQADMARIFERFYRVDKRTDGSGIGLTISQELVHAHGGTITVASAGPGRGSCFWVTLPLA